MEIKKESNEFEVRDELEAKRKNIKTFDDLTTFLKYVEENGDKGYGAAPRAMAQAALAVAWYLANKFGITSFQAGFVMWDFVRGWSYRNNKTGLRIVDYDNMLYPQYEDKFQKTITPTVWESLQKEAKERLENDTEYTHPKVIEHWKSIANGVVPFGYEVKEE